MTVAQKSNTQHGILIIFPSFAVAPSHSFACKSNRASYSARSLFSCILYVLYTHTYTYTYILYGWALLSRDDKNNEKYEIIVWCFPYKYFEFIVLQCACTTDASPWNYIFILNLFIVCRRWQFYSLLLLFFLYFQQICELILLNRWVFGSLRCFFFSHSFNKTRLWLLAFITMIIIIPRREDSMSRGIYVQRYASLPHPRSCSTYAIFFGIDCDLWHITWHNACYMYDSNQTGQQSMLEKC